MKFGKIKTKSGSVPVFEMDGGRLADICTMLKQDGFTNE